MTTELEGLRMDGAIIQHRIFEKNVALAILIFEILFHIYSIQMFIW